MLSPACGAWVRNEVSPSEAGVGLTNQQQGHGRGHWGSTGAVGAQGEAWG